MNCQYYDYTYCETHDCCECDYRKEMEADLVRETIEETGGCRIGPKLVLKLNDGLYWLGNSFSADTGKVVKTIEEVIEEIVYK